MGNELRNKILEYNGISIEPLKKIKPTVSNCPRCELVNAVENKYCSKCSYPLTIEAFDMIKQDEEKRFVELEKKLDEKNNQNMANLIKDIEKRLDKLLINVDVQKLL
jgi:integrase/recombinase XerD